MVTAEALRFSPEQQQAYRQIAGFFGGAESEYPAAARQLVSVVGGLVGEQRTTREKLQEGMGNIDIGLALIGDWLKEAGAEGFEVKLGFGGGTKKAIGRSQVKFPTASDLIRIGGRVDPKLQAQIPPLLSSFSRQIREALDIGLSPRQIVGGLVAESVGSRLSANGSANLRQALNKPLGGHFEWIRQALGIADVAGQPVFKEETVEPQVEISNVVEVGSVKPGMIPTLLEGKVLETIHDYLSRDTRNEQGGFVIFHVETDSMKRQVARVKDFMPTHLGKATGVSFQWISDDFTEAHRYVDQRWPGSMLGFIHSHPGMSVGPTGEKLDSFIIKGYCKEPFIPFLIYNPVNRTINDLRWDKSRNQAASVGGILVDQAGLSKEMGLQFVDTDFFGGPGRGYKATLVPSGKSLEESIEISEAVPAAAKGEEIARRARVEQAARWVREEATAPEKPVAAEKKAWQEAAAPKEPAEVELTLKEKVFVAQLEDLVDLEGSTTAFDSSQLQKHFEGMKSWFFKLPVGGQLRQEVMKNVLSQLGDEGEKMRKARKSDEQIFEEWLKLVFIPLYKRSAGK